MIVEGPGPIRAQLSFLGRPTISYTLGRASNTCATDHHSSNQNPMAATPCRPPAAFFARQPLDDPFPGDPNPRARLSISKPTWIVKTESNVWKESRKKPHPACAVCHGIGRVDCRHCHGRGRTNCVEHTLLPKGEWPRWCRTCGGSGLDYCPRCLGTGEHREVMGFHFMKQTPK